MYRVGYFTGFQASTGGLGQSQWVMGDDMPVCIARCCPRCRLLACFPGGSPNPCNDRSHFISLTTALLNIKGIIFGLCLINKGSG